MLKTATFCQEQVPPLRPPGELRGPTQVRRRQTADTVDAVYGTALDIGHTVSGNQQTGGIDNFTVHEGSFTDAEVVAL